MKLRCTQNSVRLRVRKSDLQTLIQTGQVEETVQFGPKNLFRFILKIDSSSNAVHATFDDRGIIVFLPKKEAENWAKSSQVGLETTQALSNGAELHLLIEKDFPCVDRADENKEDTFWELVPDEPDAC